MNDLQKMLRDLIMDWHGRWHGATKELAERVRVDTGEDIYKRLGRELGEHRPSWEIVTLVVKYCRPEKAESDWQTTRLEILAGAWHAERGYAPWGYTGRVVYADEIVREVLASSAEAVDPVTRAVLLERERMEAERVAESFRRQVEALSEQTEDLKSYIRSLEEAAQRGEARLATEVQGLEDRLRSVQIQLDRSTESLQRYANENAELQDLEVRLRAERDNARALADQRFEQLERARSEADEAQQRLRMQVVALDDQIVGLHSRIGEYESVDGSGSRSLSALHDRIADLVSALEQRGANNTPVDVSQSMAQSLLGRRRPNT